MPITEIKNSVIPTKIVNCNSNCDIKIFLDRNSSNILSGFIRLKGFVRSVANDSLKPKVEVINVIIKRILLVFKFNFSICIFDKWKIKIVIPIKNKYFKNLLKNLLNFFEIFRYKSEISDVNKIITTGYLIKLKKIITR